MMHFHADHSLFFERRQPLSHAAASLGLTAAVLVGNAGAQSTLFSLVGAGVGLLLLIHAFIRGQRRLEPAFTWALALVAGTVLGGTILQGDIHAVGEAAARISCGVIWILWLGTRLDWAALRALLLRIRVSHDIVGALDHALMHGTLTQREWVRRTDAARLRLGTPRLPLSVRARLLGEGAMHAFLRLEQVEENALLRSQSANAAGTAPVLHLSGVEVKRGGHVVLESLDLRLEPGEVLLLCGPSGAGKSSLLRLFAGLDVPSQGVVSRLGTEVTADTPLQARLDGRIGLLGQNPEEHFVASTVAEDIEWGLLRRGIDETEARRRCIEIAQALAVEHLLERPCHALSFGEQRRVALAGLLVLEPALLLLDEPTSGLDPVAAQSLRSLVEQLVERTGAACVWTTHDLASVPRHAHRVVLVRDGRTVFDGPVGEGLSQHWLERAGLALPQKEQSAC